MKILIVEDDANIRDTLRDMLQLNGYAVIAGADGLEAIGLLVHRPFLIFCDIHMPRMDGFEFRAHVRKIPEFARVPFVFLSAESDSHFLNKARELEAGFLSKPFTMQDLLTVIEEMGSSVVTLGESSGNAPLGMAGNC